jgi:hypothetical protein
MGKVIAFPTHRIQPLVTATAPQVTPDPYVYEPVADTAKRIRAELKTTFPGVKFSVRSDSASLCTSVNVRWMDGPTEPTVERVTDKYASVRRCEITGDILGGGNRFISCSRDYSTEFKRRAQEIAKTLPPDHAAYRYPEMDGSPNLHIVLGEMES